MDKSRENEEEPPADEMAGEGEPLDLELIALELGICELQRALEKATTQEERAQLRKDLAKAIADHRKILQFIEGSQPPYEILTEEDLEELGEDETPDLIEGLLKEGGSMMIVSPGGTVKSWLGQHIAECIGSGSPFLGKYQVQTGNVLIIDAENLPREIRKRLRMIRNSLGIEMTKRVCILSKPDLLLDNPRHIDDLVSQLRGVQKLTLIVDPLIRFHCGNENASQDMARVTRALNRLQRELEATIIVLQHQTKPGFLSPKGRDAIRGSTELLAWPDVVLMCDRKNGEYRAEVAKNRYAHDGQVIWWDSWFDDDEGRADFTFLREEAAGVSREERAKELICNLFEKDQEWTVRAIHQALKDHRIGDKMIRDVIKELEGDGTIAHRAGAHNERFYFRRGSSLVSSLAGQLELSG